MELLYEVSSSDNDTFSNKRMKLVHREPQISVSVKNLLAFSSSVDITLVEGKRSVYCAVGFVGEPDISGCHVYIVDLNTPWELVLIKNCSSQISHLQWNHQGSKLLVGTDNGKVEIYGMVDQLLNKWQVLYHGEFLGETILCSMWLNSPRKVTVNSDKMDSMVYSEKYQTLVPYSSGGFGGKSLEGCVIVTATGLLGALVFNNYDDPTKPLIVSEKMLAIRNHIVFADMAYAEDDGIMVVSSGGNLKQPVLLNKVSVSLNGSRDKAEIKATASQSLFLNNISDYSISSVQFLNKCSTEELLISMTNKLTGNCSLVIYELVSQPITLKSRFQSNSSEPLTSLRWQQKTQIQFNNSITSICSLAYPMVKGFGGTQSPQNLQTAAILTPMIATAHSNGSIVLSRCDNLQQISSISTTAPHPQPQPPSIKVEPEDSNTRKSQTPYKFPGGQSETGMVVCMKFTWSGSVLVCLSANSHLSTYKVHPNIDASTSTLLLELGMIGGLDPWDVLMCIKPNLVDSITDRLSETFARQPQSVQSHYNAKILVMKAALYRLTSSSSARINDQQTLLVLYLVSGALKALLRPAELSSKEKGPAESLSCLLSSSGEQFADLTKVLMQMAATEYAVEAPTLQSIQQFLQWCADLALKLLSTLPDLRHSRAPGWEVCRDSKAVGTLRELIVLMRIWGLQRSSCLPAFRKTSETLDVLPHLFRLLTRLSISPHDPDDTLIDECCLLPSEIQIPNHTAYCPTRSLGMASSVIFSKGTPQQFQYGVLPLKWWVGVEINGNWMDGLRLLWLGKNPTNIKICNRCGCTTLLNLPPRSTANKAWDQRWIKSCWCGGHWKIPAFLPQPKSQDADFLNHL